MSCSSRILFTAATLLLVVASGCSGCSRKNDGIDVHLANGVVLKLVQIEPGRFQMGSPRSEQEKAQESAKEAKNDWAFQEKQHEVEISKPFHIGVYEVTQAQYETIMRSNPSFFSAGGDGKDVVRGQDTSWFPVDSVSWDDAMEFCKRLSDKEGKYFDLPTEAEWEYACRAGSTGMFAFGNTLSSKQANYNGVNQAPMIVGFFEPNGFGLYDMHGNVAEWCKDWYDKDYYGKSPRLDPPGPTIGTYRVIRGGCCYNPAAFCRSAARNFDRPNQIGDRIKGDVYGFRVVMR